MRYLHQNRTLEHKGLYYDANYNCVAFLLYLSIYLHVLKETKGWSYYVITLPSELHIDLVSRELLIDFSLTVKAATLIFISVCASAISSAKEGKSDLFIIW